MRKGTSQHMQISMKQISLHNEPNQRKLIKFVLSPMISKIYVDCSHMLFCTFPCAPFYIHQTQGLDIFHVCICKLLIFVIIKNASNACNAHYACGSTSVWFWSSGWILFLSMPLSMYLPYRQMLWFIRCFSLLSSLWWSILLTLSSYSLVLHSLRMGWCSITRSWLCSWFNSSLFLQAICLCNFTCLVAVYR